MINRLLLDMTTTEKVGQINQHLYGWEAYEKSQEGIFLTQKFKDEVDKFGGMGAIYGVYRSDPWSGKNLETGLNQEEGKYVVDLIQTYIKENTRLKIPVLISEEVPHGIQGLNTTTLPSNIAIGQTWNPKLVQKAQTYVSTQVFNRDINLGLVTCLDVMRDPRWGRSEECFSEDPILTRDFASATIKGLQSHGTIAVAKHFCAQGDGYGGLNASPSSIGERELREIHLDPLIGAIEGGCSAMMAAYNEIDGILCHDNNWLLNDVARVEFGFDGFVMADGVALDRLAILAGSDERAATRALKAGVDLSLWDDVYTKAESAVLSGELPIEVLDTAVLRILEAKDQSGLLGDSKSNEPITEEDISVIDSLSEEVFVMIKNDENYAPLKKGKRLAVVGPNADSIYNQCGDYTPFKDVSKGSTIKSGLSTMYDVVHAEGTKIAMPIEGGIQEAMSIAQDADTIIVCLGGSSTREFDTEFDANGAAISGSQNMTSGENIDLSNIAIPKEQVELVKQLHTLGKPMIAVVIQGRVHAINEIEEYFKTIYIAGFPGERAGNAFARILSGEVSPSGKMAMSIPSSNHHFPSYYNYKKSEQNEHYADVKQVSKYPFGFGLSYVPFVIENVTITHGEDITITGTITNKGDMKASEVLQVYIRHNQASVIQRIKSLKQFEKIELEAEETKSFTLKLTLDDLKIWSRNRKYEIEEGETLITLQATNYSKEFMIQKEGVQTW